VTVPAPASLDEAADRLRKRFDPEAAAGLHLRYAFELTGPGGGWLDVRVDDGHLDVGSGPPPEADARLRLCAADFFGVLAGRENADMLFMSGRLEVEGDHSLALKLRRIFRAPV
jgi:predicted lipid carrier protein YhbT